MTGPGDEIAAGAGDHGRLRAAHADREQVIGTLKAAFDQASLSANVEVYEGTMHGWCPPDSQVYNQEQAEKAWSRMLALFKTALA